MTGNRICLIVAAIFLFIAAVLSLGVVKESVSAVGVALVGFGFWALSGAV